MPFVYAIDIVSMPLQRRRTMESLRTLLLESRRRASSAIDDRLLSALSLALSDFLGTRIALVPTRNAVLLCGWSKY